MAATRTRSDVRVVSVSVDAELARKIDHLRIDHKQTWNTAVSKGLELLLAQSQQPQT